MTHQERQLYMAKRGDVSIRPAPNPSRNSCKSQKPMVTILVTVPKNTKGRPSLDDLINCFIFNMVRRGGLVLSLVIENT